MEDLFDIIFYSTVPLNQIGLFFAGLVLLGIGGLFWGYQIYRYKTCRRVKAVISGIRVSQKTSSAAVAGENRETMTEDSGVSDSVSNPDPETFSEHFKASPASGLAALLFACLMVGLPVVFIVIGSWFAFDYITLAQTGIKTQAEIIRYDESYDSESGTSYYAVLFFRDRAGHRHKVRDRMSSRPVRRGDIVDIYYDPADPGHAVMADFWHNMMLPAGFVGMGSLFLFLIFGLPAVTSSRRRDKAQNPEKPDMTGEIYYPVYSFQTALGERTEVCSTSGSSLLSNKLPGTTVRLLVSPDDPTNISRPMLKTSLAAGALFVLFGAVLVFMAVTRFETTAATGFLGGGFFAALMWKGRRAFKAVLRKTPLSKAEFAEQSRARRLQAAQETRLLSKTEIAARMSEKDRISRYWNPVLLLMAIAMMIGGAYLGQDFQKFMLSAERAAGTVVKIERAQSLSADSRSYTYYPVVQFKKEGRVHRLRSRVGANPAPYNVGDDVTVLVDPENYHNAVIDRGFWNWAVPAGLILAGLILFYLSVKMMADIRRRRTRL